MRKITLQRALLFASLLLMFTACSKDSNLPVTYTKAVKLPSEPPVPLYGAIKGIVNPIPQVAQYSLANEEFNMSNKVNQDGTFYMDNIPQGVYQLNFTYLIVRPEYSYYASYTIDRVEVMGGNVTQLGEVRLPWTY